MHKTPGMYPNKKNIPIIFLFLLFAWNLSAQDNINQNDETFIEFGNLMEKICAVGSDTIITFVDTLLKYKVKFSSHGDFIDPKNRLFRITHQDSIKTEVFFAEVAHLSIIIDTLRSYYKSSSCDGIVTCIVNDLYGDKLTDSMLNIQSEPSFWASCVTAEEIRFSKEITQPLHFLKDYNNSAFALPSIISYHNGKYLIVDTMTILVIGNQTDRGIVTTYYMERMD